MIALAPIFGSPTSAVHGWIFTTIGITAVLFGIRARRIDAQSAFVRSTTAIGIGSGVVATATMVALMVLAMPQNGHARYAPVQPAIAAPVRPATPLAAAPPAQPEVVTDPSAGVTARDLALDAGTIGFVLRNAYGVNGPWPAALVQTETHAAIDPATGRIIHVLPAGVTLLYMPSADRTTFSLRLSLDADPTQHADLDSTAAVVSFTR